VETGRPLPSSEPVFHTDDAEQVAAYHTISALAVVGLLFGLASPLCFGSPVFFAIPLVGAAVSIVALGRIAASDGALAGRWVATIGLALCVVSASAAIARQLAMERIRTTQAEASARVWISLLLEGKKEDAFRLTAAANRREPPTEPGAPVPTHTPYDHFLEQPVISELTAAGSDAKVEFVETLSYEPQPARQYIIRQKFLVTPIQKQGAHSHPLELLLTMQRSKLPSEPRSRWLVGEYESPQAPAGETHIH
jgi:hypothetical protein